MPPGPLLCDLDGTIADTAPAIFASLRVTCEAIGFELTPERELSWALGPPLHWCLTQLGVTEDLMGEAIDVFERAHVEHVGLVKPMPDADTVIRDLAGRGVAIGIATIKPQALAELVLDTIGLHDCMQAVHGRADDLDARTKTDLLRELRTELDGGRPLYVGDHDNDELAAAELAIPFLRYPDTPWDAIRSAVLATADVP